MILHQAGDFEEAEKALRNAILIAPGYAEAFANLAALAGRLGRTIQAERLQGRAVELAPGDRTFREQIEAYRALLPEKAVIPAPAPGPVELESEATAEGDLSVGSPPGGLRLDRYDWNDVEHELTEHGCAVLEGLLTAEDCQRLIALWGRHERFEKTVHLAPSGATVQRLTEAGGTGAYRFFRR